MKPIKKISDFVKVLDIETNLYIPLVRLVDTDRLWAGGHVDDILAYRKPFSSVDESVLVKRSNDRLRQHLDAEFPHLLEDRDETDYKAYKFTIETTRGALELVTQSEQDSFVFDNSKDYLKFEDMFEKHVYEDNIAYHKFFDQRDSLWKWYKIKVVEIEGEILFDFEYVASTENPEVLGSLSDQQNDFNYYNMYMDEHEESLSPHKLVESDNYFLLAIESEELVIEV